MDRLYRGVRNALGRLFRLVRGLGKNDGPVSPVPEPGLPLLRCDTCRTMTIGWAFGGFGNFFLACRVCGGTDCTYIGGANERRGESCLKRP